jgi:alpha-1,2-rhamnosyltransferase
MRQGRAPSIYVECTTTFLHDLGTGIPRVVHNVVRHLRSLAPARGYAVVPVYLDDGVLRKATVDADGRLRSTAPAHAAPAERSRARRAMDGIARALPPGPARDFVAAPSTQPGLARLLRNASGRLRPKQSAALGSGRDGGVRIEPGDILLHADIDLAADFGAMHATLRKQGTRVCAIVYDLIPLRYSEIWPALPVRQFRDWVHRTLAGCDAIFAISRVVKEDIERYFEETPGLSRPRSQVIEWFHLGHDMDVVEADAQVRPEVAAIFAAGVPVLLSVGWLDPRKNQARLIEALDALRQRGVAVKLFLAGRRGFGTDEVHGALAAHPGVAGDVHLHHDVSDAELRFAFMHARALVYPSYAEGFGLPLVEALRYGLPVLASDIPIFREIAGAHAVYFDPFDVQSMVSALEAFVVRGDYAPARLAQRFTWISWEESVARLLDLLVHVDPRGGEFAGRRGRDAGAAARTLR